MQYTADTLTTYRTGCKEIDWMIDRAKVSDMSDADGLYFIGEFRGNMPYRMLTNAQLWLEQKAGKRFATGYAETDGETFHLAISLETGSMKSTATQARFYISYVAESK